MVRSYFQRRDVIASFLLLVFFIADVLPGFSAMVNNRRNGYVFYPITSGINQPNRYQSFNEGFRFDKNGGSTPSQVLETSDASLLAKDGLEIEGEEDIDGPTQPEFNQFKSVGANNMVDLFTGDFSYNIPLIDVGGYPLGISYSGNVGMDQEASWVGLGWNINPGSISRNVRGIPDEYDGHDSIISTVQIKPRTNVGGGISPYVENFGWPLSISTSLGFNYDSKTGWGMELGINPSVNLAAVSNINGMGLKLGDTLKGINASLGIKLSSNEGASFSPGLGVNMKGKGQFENGEISIGTNYNSRSGLGSLTVGGAFAYRQASNTEGRNSQSFQGSFPSASISFARPSARPTIPMPYTTRNGTFSIGLGYVFKPLHLKVNLSGYFSETKIDELDETQIKPAYGYMHFGDFDVRHKSNFVVDINRDKEQAYSVQPLSKNIAIPIYTYDAFTISGEATGGMFRPFRSEIGFTTTPLSKTSNSSVTGGIDLGFGSGFKWGANVELASTISSVKPWITGNGLVGKLAFRKDSGSFESVYFKNPGELAISDPAMDELIGQEKLVKLNISQSSSRTDDIRLNPKFDIYENSRIIGSKNLGTNPQLKKRATRTQSISYLTATEASQYYNPYLVSYDTNYFAIGCEPDPNRVEFIKRIDSSIHKRHHISMINVVNADGRRYEYGIPVYNLEQREVTYSLAKGKIPDANNQVSSLVEEDKLRFLNRFVGYRPKSDLQDKSTDQYFNRQITPANAHSYLLSSIASPDYVDATGNGPSEDDAGDAIQFNYSRIYGSSKNTAYRWRSPFNSDYGIPSGEAQPGIVGKILANYEAGLKTDYRDDKASYIYGEKEVWYLHGIESKTLFAAFILEPREDAASQQNEMGGLEASQQLLRLKEIRLYNKADYAVNGSNAKPVKVVHFEYDYSLCPGFPLNPVAGHGKLTLKKIWFTYNGNSKGKQNPYVFSYRNNQSYQFQSADTWGNYKDVTDNPGGLSNTDYPYNVNNVTKANKTENIAPWALNTISTPTGSKISVTYEADQYAYVQNKRAAQLFKVVGLGKSADFSQADSRIYEDETDARDHRFVFVEVPESVSTKKEVYQKYLEGLPYLYFRVAVKMGYDPNFDIQNKQYEFVKLYAKLDGQQYGVVPNQSGRTIIWFKIAGTDKKKTGGGNYSPIAKAAIQFLRNELPSKAYPGSEFPTDKKFNAKQFATMFLAAMNSVKPVLNGFHTYMKKVSRCKYIDTSISFVRLNVPGYNKVGGGYRVKRVEISDNWNAMTGQKEAKYGMEYQYTNTVKIDGKVRKISSGVATYEPFVGGEENPFRFPIENYDEQLSPLGPVNSLYSEGPLMESFFPAPSVGYAKVRMVSIHSVNIKSKTGIDETEFYTSRDFPVITTNELTPMADGFKKFNSPLRSLLKINSKEHFAFSQGFKIELNDMNGKMKSQSSYGVADSLRPISRSEYFYQSKAIDGTSRQLQNKVKVASKKGEITEAELGRNIEVMIDVRNQETVMQSGGINTNYHFFTISIFPVFIPAPNSLPKSSDTWYRSAAVTKVVNRLGILDSVVVHDKGSVVSTKNDVFDAETGQVLVSRTNNEFDKPVFGLSLPAHWAYDRMGFAASNVGTTVPGVTLRDGKLQGAASACNAYFVPGDEVMATGGRIQGSIRLTVIDASTDTLSAGYIDPIKDRPGRGNQYQDIRFITDDGKLFNTNRFFGFTFLRQSLPSIVNLKIMRSGRRNMPNSSIGSYAMLDNPVRGNYIRLDSLSRVINSSAMEMKEDWKVLPSYWKVDSCNPVCECPEGYALDPSTNICSRIVYDTMAFSSERRRAVKATGHIYYTNSGVSIHNSLAEKVTDNHTIVHQNEPDWTNTSSQNTSKGVLNKIGLWVESFPGSGVVNELPYNEYVGFLFKLNVPQTKTYYIGVASDNHLKINVDCETVLSVPKSEEWQWQTFNYWHIYPIVLTKGEHTLELTGSNQHVVASFGAEIYDNSLQDIINASNRNTLNRLFSTGDYFGKYLHVSNSYGGRCPGSEASCPTIDESGNLLCQRIDTVSANCIKTDIKFDSVSFFNPYKLGLLGNYRPYRSYVFKGARVEQNATTATNIQTNGVLTNFNSFWKMGSQWLEPNYKTEWVWNEENTLFGRRGESVETKDALGMYNAAQYAYNNTLPIAVVRNSKYRESAFDGFEDYTYRLDTCGTGNCGKVVLKHFDWTKEKSKIVSSTSHSGLYSLRVGNGDAASFTANLSDTATDNRSIWLRLGNTSGVISNTSALQPIFSPTKKDSFWVSVWVRDSMTCTTGYYNAEMKISFGTGTSFNQTVTLKPVGLIVEGWQKIEGLIVPPANMTTVKIELRSSSGVSNVAYFDDLRIHPYHAGMKSIVYDPVSLRVMAELDENNYATYYEYDDDGTLVRVKKETERGIKTITETRSALIK